MKRVILLIVICLSNMFTIIGQKKNVSPELIMDRLQTHIDRYPLEKLHLHLDRISFFQGEDIWFKAYLTDAFLRPSEAGSHYMYAELINPVDSIVKRVMIAPEEGQFHGNLPVPDDLAEGLYTLRAYTRYMQNMGEESFFRKTIQINSVLASQIRPHYTFDYSRSDNKIYIDLYYTAGPAGKKIKPDKLQMRNIRGYMQNIRTDKDTIAHISYDLPLKERQRMLYMEVDNFKHYIPMPVETDDYDVSFFPEGLRTTIYWKPNVVLNEEGKVDLEFYTADTPSTYSIVVEGLTGDGKPIRKLRKIWVR